MTEHHKQSAGIGIRSLFWGGLLLIASAFGGFGVWATTFELSAAAIAPGRIGPDGSQRIVQHLEGGLIETLPVREGQIVRKGEFLVVLSKVQAAANHAASEGKLQRLKICRARLQTEMQVGEVAVFDFAMEKEDGDERLAFFVQNERTILDSRTRMRRERLDVLDQQEAQVLDEIRSVEAEIEGIGGQLEFSNEEVQAKRKLLEKGLVRVPQLFAVERKRVEFESRIEALNATIARARQKIGEIDVAKLNLRTEAIERASDEMAEVNRQIAQAREAEDAAKDVLSRTKIRSPIKGHILKLHFKTLGGVVRPGDPIAVVVPRDDELVIDARLLPFDVDNVALGMKANVQLRSFMARHLKPLKGEVVLVGADVLTDERTKTDYFPMNVRVRAQDLASLGQSVRLSAGMPAEVFVQTGTHTPLRYLADPLVASMRRAFREEATHATNERL